MGKSFSTILLALGALVMVAVGGFVIVTTALSDDDSETAGSSDTNVSGEQHVYLTNLGMT
jgi:hypothetical protein